jgi:hypothetical protein
MHRTLCHRLAAVALAAAAGVVATTAIAGPELMDVDTRFRAKIAKEKIRMAAQEREAAAKGKLPQTNGQCGSQAIGNIDTGGRIGAAPREVFVFAPNAINIVGRGSCR